MGELLKAGKNAPDFTLVLSTACATTTLWITKLYSEF